MKQGRKRIEKKEKDHDESAQDEMKNSKILEEKDSDNIKRKKDENNKDYKKQ